MLRTIPVLRLKVSLKIVCRVLANLALPWNILLKRHCMSKSEHERKTKQLPVRVGSGDRAGQALDTVDTVGGRSLN